MGTSQQGGLLGWAGVWKAPGFEMSLLMWLHEKFLPGYYGPHFFVCHTCTAGLFWGRRGNIRKFMVHILLKPGLENFEHYFTSV